MTVAHSAKGRQANFSVHSLIHSSEVLISLYHPTGQQGKESGQGQGSSKAVPALSKPRVQSHPQKPRLRLTNTGLRQELIETMQLYRVSLVDAVSASEALICPDNNLAR